MKCAFSTTAGEVRKRQAMTQASSLQSWLATMRDATARHARPSSPKSSAAATAIAAAECSVSPISTAAVNPLPARPRLMKPKR